MAAVSWRNSGCPATTCILAAPQNPPEPSGLPVQSVYDDALSCPGLPVSSRLLLWKQVSRVSDSMVAFYGRCFHTDVRSGDWASSALNLRRRLACVRAADPKGI